MILDASPETVHWGFFDATLPPVTEVASGSEITIRSVSGGPNALPPTGFYVPPELLAIHTAGVPATPGHILTGPVAVTGATPGQVLEVDILDVTLRQDWGYNFIRPLAGTLPMDFTETIQVNIPLDAERMTARMPWGRISTIEPRAHGGNLDCKELVAGTTLYLPIHAPRALFSVGDGHGAQGDGEVNVTAIETALAGRFRLTLRDDMAPVLQAEIPTHWITLATDADLDKCARIATRNMIALVVAKTGITREEAYMLCSLAGDLRVTQTVNREKGVHMMMAKALL